MISICFLGLLTLITVAVFIWLFFEARGLDKALLRWQERMSKECDDMLQTIRELKIRAAILKMD